MLSGGVLLLSPLWQSLTGSVSADTVVACAAAALLLHLYLHDYAPGHDVTQTVGGAVSLGAAMAASVLLASRLRSARHVAACMLFSVQAFVAWPFLARDLARASRTAHATAAIAAHTATLAALRGAAPLLVAVHAAVLLFITFVCPWSLVRCHKLKRRINGCVLIGCIAWRVRQPDTCATLTGPGTRHGCS